MYQLDNIDFLLMITFFLNHILLIQSSMESEIVLSGQSGCSQSWSRSKPWFRISGKQKVRFIKISGEENYGPVVRKIHNIICFISFLLKISLINILNNKKQITKPLGTAVVIIANMAINVNFQFP
ncbi:hypothetical protein BpHYR1_049623 [Brachionus plicatilis]|uniref:Uncharacterized protein n=1 Tax=Brachionus plicatilis TaxID=10195 RepID=A0A3M7T2R9_BRAPC|nr:hypothetical protein BpHYR1_049623 [Brachionus plicatilis]